MRTKLAASSVHSALLALEGIGVVEGVGSTRSRVYRLQRRFALNAMIETLFGEEERRYGAILDEFKSAAEDQGPGVLAVWLYGSVARGADRPGSDVDVVVVVNNDPARFAGAMQTRLQTAEETWQFRASLVVITLQDVGRLRDAGDHWWTNVTGQAKILLGPGPSDLVLPGPTAERRVREGKH